MAEEIFSDNLLRMIVAEMHVSNCAAAARDLFQRSYYALGQTERAIVDKTILDMVAGNFQVLTADFLASQKQQNPVGFVPPQKPA